MKRTMYQAARHTPKRGAGSSNLLGDAMNTVTARGCGIFLSRFRCRSECVLPVRLFSLPQPPVLCFSSHVVLEFGMRPYTCSQF